MDNHHEIIVLDDDSLDETNYVDNNKYNHNHNHNDVVVGGDDDDDDSDEEVLEVLPRTKISARAKRLPACFSNKPVGRAIVTQDEKKTTTISTPAPRIDDSDRLLRKQRKLYVPKKL